jgi:ABC-type uncharacterized transport system permease subunit
MKVQLIRRDTASRAAMIGAPILALALACFASLILFSLLGKPAGTALYALLLKPFLSWYSFSEVLLKMAPLLLIAQGLAIGFRANVFNIGAEGQFIVGAVCASALPVYYPDGAFPLMLPAMIIAGAVGGMVYAMIAAGLRTRFGTSEILVTLMLSLIAVQILNYLLLGPWKDPRGFEGTRTNISLLFALVASVLAHFLMQNHFCGYQLRTSGLAPRAASYAGFSAPRMIWLSLALGGLAAGIAGASEVTGPLGQLQRSVPSGYGYAAIIVAYVGGLRPLGIVASSFLISVVYIGGDSATVTAGLPVAAVEVFQGFMLVFYLLTFTLIRYQVAFVKKTIA